MPKFDVYLVLLCLVALYSRAQGVTASGITCRIPQEAITSAIPGDTTRAHTGRTTLLMKIP